MEEFKNLKEIIELCKEELDKNDENVNATLDLEDLKELQNLINKYKELEKERDGIYTDYQDLGKEKLKLEEKCEEQEKMIELMVDELSLENALNCVYKEYKGHECIRNDDFDCKYSREKCKNCIKEFYKKKAKGE